jgi:single-stranded-DNA-specific exonuclease
MRYTDRDHILNTASQKLSNQIEHQKDIFILSNSTVDGLVGSAIFLSSIHNSNGNTTIRCLNSLKFEDFKIELMKLVNEKHEFYVFVDFDSKCFDLISSLIQESYCLFVNSDLCNLDQIIDKDKAVTFVNPWIWQRDSDKENKHTSSSLTYLIAKNFDRKIIYSSFLPIVAAFSKNIDFNNTDQTELKEILQSALDLNLIERKKGLNFGASETTPIVDAMENNTAHFIKGITWNKENSLKILEKSGIQIKDSQRIRTWKELEDEDFNKIFNAIEKYMEENGHHKNKSDDNIKEIKKRNRDLLFGYNYILTNEESDSILKNIESFSKSLDLCVRNQTFGLGLAICLGDRDDTMIQIKNQIIDYDNRIKSVSNKIFEEKWRFYDDKETVYINGEGILDEKNIELFTSILEKSVSFADRLICLRILSTENEEEYKYTLIKPKLARVDFLKIKKRIYELAEIHGELNSNNSRSSLTTVTLDIADKIEIRVPIINLEVFLSNIKKIVLDAKGS